MARLGRRASADAEDGSRRPVTAPAEVGSMSARCPGSAASSWDWKAPGHAGRVLHLRILSCVAYDLVRTS